MTDKQRDPIAWVERVCLIIAGTALIILMLLTTVDTLRRYCFSAPLTGVLEFSEEYLMIALIFMPISYVFIAGGHIKVELLERYFPPKVKWFLGKMNILIGLILFIVITAASFPVVQEAIEIGEHSSSAIEYPMAPAYAMVTIGCFLLCVRSIQMFMGKISEH